MKQITISLLLLVGSFFTVQAQEKVPLVVGQSETIVDGPVIKVESAVCNLGEIKEGVQAKAEFKVTNTGNMPLVITGVSRSCGCTKVEYPKKPLMPGDEAIISAVYNSKGRPGNFTKTLTVKHNAEGGNLYLTLKGRVIKTPTEH